MPRQIAIRLGTEGRAQVVMDAEAIGAAHDGAAKRAANAWVKASRDADQAMEFANRQARKLEALLPGLNPTKLDMAAGVRDNVGKSAESSAAVFSAAYAQMERRAEALRAAIDPAWAAQQRFDREIAEARTLMAAGVLTLDEYSKAAWRAHQGLDAAGGGQVRVGQAATGMGRAFASASPQIQDFFVQVSMGANPINALVVQGGQLAGQLVYMEGKAGSFARFLMGPYGLSLQVGLLLMAQVIAKMVEFGEETDKAVEKLKKEAAEAETNARAKERFKNTIEGVTAALREQQEAQEKATQAAMTAGERANIQAQQELARAQRIRQSTIAMLEQATAAQRNLAGPGISSERGIGFAQREAREQAEWLEARLEQARAVIGGWEEQLQLSRVELAAEAAKRGAGSAADRIAADYDKRIAAAKKEADEAVKAGAKIDQTLTRRIYLLEVAKQKAVDAAKERDKPPPRDSDTLTSAAVAKMLRGALPGVRIGSTDRSAAENARVGGAANSYHLRKQAVDFVPAGGMGSMTKDDVRRIFESRGIDIIELLGPGDPGHSDHFHVAWTKGKNALDEFTDAAKRAEERKKGLEALMKAFDPAAAAALEYRKALEEIDRFKPDDAESYRWAARTKYVKAVVPNATVDKGLADFGSTSERRRRASDRYDDTLADQKDRLALRRRELELLGANDNYRQAEIEKLRIILDFRRLGTEAAGLDLAQLLQNNDALAAMEEQLRRQEGAWREIEDIGGSAIDRLFDTRSADDWWGRIKGILGDFQAELVRLALINPLKNMLFGQSNSTLGNVFSLFGAKGAATGSHVSIPKNAAGTEYWSGGATWLAENGPEIVDLPRGTRITPAAETRRRLAQNDNPMGGGINVNVYANDAVLAETVRGWVAQGIDVAAAKGALGGARMGAVRGARAQRYSMAGN